MSRSARVLCKIAPVVFGDEPGTASALARRVGRGSFAAPAHGASVRTSSAATNPLRSTAVSYRAMIDRIGWKKAQRQLGISLPGGRAPTALELKDAAREYGWSVITLTPR